MDRVYNFSAGPAALPVKVLEKAQKQLVAYESAGMSVMEMSHRSAAFEEIIANAQEMLRRLMNIPPNYHVLFLQGGASSQFSMVPMNLMRQGKADFVITGQWAKKAAEEAARYGSVNKIASSADRTFAYIPELDTDTFDREADYFHITVNNTIFGTRFSSLPDTGNVPLVTDMSSSILSEVYDVNRFGLIYAGAQKNIGPAGLTIVIIRDDLVGTTLPGTPTMFDYKVHVENKSLYNTPPTFAVYIAMLVFEWLLEQGGVSAIQRLNEEKAALLYDFLDASKLFEGTVDRRDRSLMNVPFVTGKPDVDAKFIKEAKQAGLVNLGGHRSVGGMRASIYNAMPREGVEALVVFMKKFEADNI
ncbi:MAG: 3-phosphoserine/phosphohydroxythreonine transaminase [Peptococcaceae bacterium]|nr:3-phosphoserine/phosphohydroxythreonine transaminase [Peptococcaceae bacterium]